MEWFKANKLKIGGGLTTLGGILEAAGLSDSPLYKLIVHAMLVLGPFIAGAGSNIKSDKQVKAEASLEKEFTPKRVTD